MQDRHLLTNTKEEWWTTELAAMSGTQEVMYDLYVMKI